MAGTSHLCCTQTNAAKVSQWVSTPSSTTEVLFPAGAGLGSPVEQFALPWGFGL